MVTTKSRERPGRERLTRERVIDAALTVMDAEGLDAVTMRRVAREVGVEAMSLYNHVEDKDDLLRGICDRVMGGFEFPEREGDWAERAKAGARAWRRLLQAHPDMMRLFAETDGPDPASPDSLRPTEFALSLIHEGGLSDRDTVQAFHAFGGYIQGFVMMEGGSLAERAKGGFGDEAAAIPADAFPVLAALGRYFAECDPDEQFEFGLDLMIRGIEAKVAADAVDGSAGSAAE
ncbi:MAG TPA: TetR/AcrR family transcriptional regulator [Actinomycetota bacterium]|nr:TetR/AcrR family transcriptional regulator [Actinomycetota bacterium]